ncbi:sugar ABC transporter ATP-binding protein [Peptoniphilus catoniae]|uniref:sugar ABC transporter ATP-binding protein n=1 Tax=Peptoniphilus catoniae TaxID=1660341 RepID=UPI0010FDC980|nr:sugar ABC transporter ATP-binding protein [Peptoniphilus catoniae]
MEAKLKEPLLKMENISKSFPGVKALDKVSLNVYAGEVMALLGENGAGKSTLMKILSGSYKADEGKIILRGEEINVDSPLDATKKGISIIHQELNLLPHMSVYENVFLGRELTGSMGMLKKSQMIKETEKVIKRLNINIDPKIDAGLLSIAQQQMVEIAKALSINADIIILDEPTDTLTTKESDVLFNIIRELKAQGKGLIFISHKLEEVFEICDRVTVFRDGKLIGEEEVSQVDEDKIITMMVGRSLDEQFPHIDVPGEEVFRVEGLNNKYIKNISFGVNRGEILGISGLVGAGRTELAKTIFGHYPLDSGRIYLEGEEIRVKSPREALSKGIVYVSEDRKGESLVIQMNVMENITLSALDKFKRVLAINKKLEKEASEDYVKKIRIKTPTVRQRVKNLSGGNQQKVAIAKSLLTDPKILILDEPTRGIDVGAKKEIYELLNTIKEEGKAIIIISSDMQEILGMSDRVIVMNEGRQKAIIKREEVTQEKIMSYIMKVEETENEFEK